MTAQQKAKLVQRNKVSLHFLGLVTPGLSQRQVWGRCGRKGPFDTCQRNGRARRDFALGPCAGLTP